MSTLSKVHETMNGDDLAMLAPISDDVPDAEVTPPSLSKTATHIRRQRTKRACTYCRTRKVRCDVATKGPPCTSCQRHCYECVFDSGTPKWLNVRHAKSRESKGQLNLDWAIDTKTPQPSVASAFDSALVDVANPQDEPIDAQATLAPPFSYLQEQMHNSLDDGDCDFYFPQDSEPLSMLGHFIEPESPQQPDQVINEEIRDGLMLTLPGTTSPKSWDNSSADEALFPPLPSQSAASAPVTFITCAYYRFVDAGAMFELSPHDVTFLEQKGCFHLPARPALDEFLRQYFIYSHPILPLFNESKFWRMYSSQHRRAPPQNRIPLFVLQAILFVSCPFVSTSVLSSLGFQSIQAARRDFYSRAKALFDFSLHKDDVANAQGTLMLTYHSPSTTDKVNTYWLESAIHFARNAHADHYHTADIPQQDKPVLKRLWWCCILRDRIMSLSFRRPLNIRPDDFDFDQAGLEESDFINEIRGPSVYNAPAKRSLAHMIASLCELAAILNGVLALLYPRRNKRNQTTDDSVAGAQSLLERLDSWQQNAKSSLTVSERTLSRNKPLLLFAKMISIYYHTAKAAMCHHILLLAIPKLKNLTYARENCLQSQSNLTSSLQGITNDLKELAPQGLIDYLPNTFVPFLAFPFTWNILQVKVLMTENQSSGDQRDLLSYTSAMRTLRGLYEMTDSTLDCIENIVTFIKNDECSTVLRRNPFIHHPLSLNLGILETSEPSGNVWVDLLLENPHTYLRIALTVDFSLAHGQFPSADDISKVFQGDSKDISLNSEEI